MSSTDIKSFARILSNGLKFYLKNENVIITKTDFQILENELISEFSLPYNDQSKTPTQFLNEFVKNKYSFEKLITPQNLGPDVHEQIMLWGLKKAKNFNE
jgi:hypothetical protein|tara:strand:- start:33 stop:332 length:300 start_codon:yes stop_codon:yes gene_type:complete